MISVNQGIRNKRFLCNKKLPFVFDRQQQTIQAIVLNASLTGALIEVSETEYPNLKLCVDDIVSNAKVVLNDQEFFVGRSSIKNIRYFEDLKSTVVGIKFIDHRIPIDSDLSCCFDLSLQESLYDFELSPQKFNLSHFYEDDISSIDLFEKCSKYQIFYKAWSLSNNFLYRETRKPSKGKRVILNRRRKAGRKDFLAMGSNDYFGLAAHPKVCEAAKQAIDDYGLGSTGSPITTGLTDLHHELSNYISGLFKKDKTILFNSGYAANLGTIQALCNASDVTFLDVLSHASIQDGVKLSRAHSRLFAHNNIRHLEKLMHKDRKNFKGALTIAEGVFSMDGDVPPLDKIYALSQKYSSRLMVDEAHSFGVIGNNGLGTCEKFNLIEKTDLIMGTFSKVCGSIGGFVCCSEAAYNWLCSFSRANIFSVSLPPCNVAATLQAIKLFQEDKTYINSLHKNIKIFKEGLSELGYKIPASHESAVIPFVIGNEEKMAIVLECLIDNGIFPTPVIYPATSRSSCRLRFTILASHNESDMDYAISILEKAVAKADLNLEAISNEQLKKIYK